MSPTRLKVRPGRIEPAGAYMKTAFYLILPDIRSCHNVGAMFRTADAFGVTKLILAGYTAAPPKAQIDKVSLGAEQWIPFEKIKNADVIPLVKNLKERGFCIIGLEKDRRSVPMADVNISGPVALVVGNEVDGIPADILDTCDTVMHIPMRGRKESLNVSVAAGIAMHYISRQING